MAWTASLVLSAEMILGTLLFCGDDTVENFMYLLNPEQKKINYKSTYTGGCYEILHMLFTSTLGLQMFTFYSVVFKYVFSVHVAHEKLPENL